MKICVITSYWPTTAAPSDGRSAYQTIRALSKMPDIKIDVLVVSSKRPFRKHTVKPLQESGEKLRNVKITSVGFSTIPFFSRHVNGRTFQAAVEPYVRDGNFDLLIGYFLYPAGYAVSRLGKKLGIPTVLKAIGSDVNRAHRFSWKTWMAINEASRVITVSDPLSERIKFYMKGITKVLTIKNGCDHKIFHYRDQQGSQTVLGFDPTCQHILYVGRLDLRKGLRELIRAFADISDPNIRLHIVGTGPAKRELVELCNLLKLESAIQFLGLKNSQEVAQLLCAADLFVLPSYNEGGPNSLLEALNCGCPVVATSVGAIPQMVGKDGEIVESRKVSSLVTGMRRALENITAGKYDRLAISKRHMRSWEEVAEEVREVFCALV